MRIKIFDDEDQGNSFPLFLCAGHYPHVETYTTAEDAMSVFRMGYTAWGAELGGTLRHRIANLVERVAELRRVIRSRRELASLDERLLADIGLSPGAAQFEASRAPWDVTPRPRSRG